MTLLTYTDPFCKNNLPVSFLITSQDCLPGTCCNTTLTAVSTDYQIYAKYDPVDVCPFGDRLLGTSFMKLYSNLYEERVRNKNLESNNSSSLFMMLTGSIFVSASFYVYLFYRKRVDYSPVSEMSNYQTAL